jgi:hypothetical protein
MPYAQVSQVLHSPGDLVSDTSLGGVHYQAFIWNGTVADSNGIVGFRNGKVDTVVQTHLTG